MANISVANCSTMIWTFVHQRGVNDPARRCVGGDRCHRQHAEKPLQSLNHPCNSRPRPIDRGKAVLRAGSHPDCVQPTSETRACH
jgi:hypothetical protein